MGRKIRGFTLVEILVVVSIIALLASILFASFAQARARARDSKRIQDLLEVQKALELYFSKHGEYPASPITNDPLNRGVSCWECSRELLKDRARLTALEEFLKLRPCDPLAAVSGDSSCQFDRGGDKGYFYKVDPEQKAYRIFNIGTPEIPFGRRDDGNSQVPLRMRYVLRENADGENVRIDSLALASSNISATWQLYCKFNTGQNPCANP